MYVMNNNNYGIQLQATLVGSRYVMVCGVVRMSVEHAVPVIRRKSQQGFLRLFKRAQRCRSMS
jgi:hypothetical protein